MSNLLSTRVGTIFGKTLGFNSWKYWSPLQRYHAAISRNIILNPNTALATIPQKRNFSLLSLLRRPAKSITFSRESLTEEDYVQIPRVTAFNATTGTEPSTCFCDNELTSLRFNYKGYVVNMTIENGGSNVNLCDGNISIDGLPFEEYLAQFPNNQNIVNFLAKLKADEKTAYPSP